MGEMADYTLESVFDYEDSRMDYIRGNLSFEQALDQGIIDEQRYEITPNTSYQKPSRICRCCGAKDLYWKKINNKFLLHKNGKIHECPKNPYIPKNA